MTSLPARISGSPDAASFARAPPPTWWSSIPRACVTRPRTTAARVTPTACRTCWSTACSSSATARRRARGRDRCCGASGGDISGLVRNEPGSRVLSSRRLAAKPIRRRLRRVVAGAPGSWPSNSCSPCGRVSYFAWRTTPYPAVTALAIVAGSTGDSCAKRSLPPARFRFALSGHFTSLPAITRHRSTARVCSRARHSRTARGATNLRRARPMAIIAGETWRDRLRPGREPRRC